MQSEVIRCGDPDPIPPTPGWNEPKKPKPEDEGDDEQQKPANA